MKNSRSTINNNNDSNLYDNNQMTGKEEPILIPSFIFQLQFPIQLWLPLAAINLYGVSIVSVNSTSDETKMMSNLSRTCKYFYRLFRPELEKQAAKKLLECFFMPIKKNVDKAKMMLLANPRLAYVKIENDKSITDIAQRPFEGSLWQASLQTGADGWINWLTERLETTNQDLAVAQYEEKFSQPDVRKTRMLNQMDIDLEAIEKAITMDPCTNGKPTLQKTQDELETMRQHLLTENSPYTVIKTGEIFPREMMQKVCKLYYKHWDDNTWDYQRLSCYSTFVIGYVPRFFVSDSLLRLLKGLCNETDDRVPLWGDFTQNVSVNNQVFELDFTHPDKYSNFRPGFHLFIDVYHGMVRSGYVTATPYTIGREAVLEKLASNKNVNHAELTQQHQNLQQRECKII